MGHLPSPEDRPDPSERSTAVRARVPEHVTTGNVSTGVIVVTGATEFVLDFVRNLPRPAMVVARVVLPHAVMPQLVEALSSNVAIFRQRFGDGPLGTIPSKTLTASDATSQAIVSAQSPSVQQESPKTLAAASDSAGERDSARSGSTSSGSPVDSERSIPQSTSNDSNFGSKEESESSGASSGPARHPSPQEVYDDLKLKDELLSGSYANAVMIGHGPHEFCFDFITNFYPQSAVSCRVFMAAGHISRLLDSLRTSWEQLRPRLGGNPPMA
jgi:hypothetical protein